MKRTVAFLFQREGKSIDKNDFIYIPSADLGWFSSEEARKLLKISEESGLISINEDTVTANFDFNSIQIPMGFEPPKNLLEKEVKKDIFPIILNEITEKTDLNRQKIMAQVNKKQDVLNINIKTALLLVAQENDVKLKNKREYIEKIEEEILEKG